MTCLKKFLKYGNKGYKLTRKEGNSEGTQPANAKNANRTFFAGNGEVGVGGMPKQLGEQGERKNSQERQEGPPGETM